MNFLQLRTLLLRIIGIIGLAIYVAVFSFTYSIPESVERFAADFIESEVQKKIGRTIDGLEPPKGSGGLSKLATSLYERNTQKIDELKIKLKSDINERMADALSQIRNLDCECRDKWAKRFQEGFKSEIGLLQTANDKLIDFIHSSYVEVVADLKRDIRIFTGINAAIFLFILIISFAKPAAITHLFLPGILLVVSTTICSYFYIFEQNWLLTIIYNDYWGFAYLTYLSLIFVLLCDIVFNKARVTTEILNAFFHVIGSAISVVPC